MKPRPFENYLVAAEFFGEIQSNQKTSFWVPTHHGILQLAEGFIEFRPRDRNKNKKLQIPLNKIVKVKMLSLKPSQNQWIKAPFGSPYWLLFWNPFWNRYLLNITYLGPQGIPRELFFKLKTKKITQETIEILKRSL